MATSSLSLEKLVQELINLRGDYSKQSSDYIRKAQLASAKFQETSKKSYLQKVQDLHSAHQKLTANYRKKSQTLNQKISDAMLQIA